MPNIALAQVSSPPTLQAFIASLKFQNYIGGLFSRLPPDVFRRCGTLVSRGSTVVELTPATFANDGNPISGAWKQSFPVSGCGNDTTINFFFTVQPSENIVTILGAPGDTHADLVLQKDAERYAAFAARTKAATCTEPYHILNTTYDGADTTDRRDKNTSPQSIRPPWRETWTISACGSIEKVALKFIPDASGTTISTQRTEKAD